MTPLPAEPRALRFAVVWTASRKVVLMSVQASARGGLWRELTTGPVAGGDGELVVAMGAFEPGPLSVRFIVDAVTDVPRIATFVVDDGGAPTALAPAEGDPPKSIAQGESWSGGGLYQVRPDVSGQSV
jgi:hypothetical protein